MKLRYRVHSVVEIAVPVKATLGDREVDATIPGLVVELVGRNHSHGHTCTFVSDSAEHLAELSATFKRGATVLATFSADQE